MIMAHETSSKGKKGEIEALRQEEMRQDKNSIDEKDNR